MRKLLPLLLPASPREACGMDAALPPTTTAPTGRPTRKPGTLAAGVPGAGSPVKKQPAREKPKRAVLSMVGENTWVSSRLTTCSRKVRMSALKGSRGVAVKVSPSAAGEIAAGECFWGKKLARAAVAEMLWIGCDGVLYTMWES